MEKPVQKIPKNNFLELEALDTIVFGVYLEPGSEWVEGNKTTLRLFNDFIEYHTNYIIEKEFIFSPSDSDEPQIAKAVEELDKKKLKIEDQGIIPLNKLIIARITENKLNDPGQGVTLQYKICLEYNDTSVEFKFSKRSEQIEIYNKLINWQIKQNNWK